MKTQCPKCKAVQQIPDHYSGKSIKCKKCSENFIAIEYEPLVPPANKNNPATPPFWAPGVYLQILGILGIFASLLFGFGYSASLGYQSATNHAFGDRFSFSEAEVFLIDTVIFGITFLGILLSFVLVGIGTAIKKIQKN